MTMDLYQTKIISAIEQCNTFFSRLKLDKQYVLFYYTIFTKSEEEYFTLCDESSKYLKLIDSGNGSTFEKISGCFLPEEVRFLRIRQQDSSNILVAGDILGKNMKNVQRELQRLGILFQIQVRPNNRILEITSDDSCVAIFFPEKHFLQDI